MPPVPPWESIEQTGIDALGETRNFLCLRDANEEMFLHDLQLNVKTHNFEFLRYDIETHRLPGEIVGNSPAPWIPASISAHANTSEIAKFIREVLGRNGLDNSGGPYVSSINCTRESSVNREWKNAAWLPRFKQVLYGQRFVDSDLLCYAAAKSIVAHEIFHGITEQTARLQCKGDPGALNESYSDIFAVLILNCNQPDISRWEWEIGESLGDTGLAIRSLEEPSRYGHPEHMDEYDDEGRVHVNNGIHNKAAYHILTAKDEHGHYFFDVISGARLFYGALVRELARTSSFRNSRRALIKTAASLFRTNSAHREILSKITEAFDIVGIKEPN